MLNQNCIESISEAVVNFYHREGYKKYDDYFLYKILPLHLGFIKAFGKNSKIKEIDLHLKEERNSFLQTKIKNQN